MLPPGLLLLSSVDESGSPMQRCFTLDGWLLAFVGVLLPLWLLDRLEQQPAASDGGGGQPGHVQGADPAPRVPWAPMQLYMLSCWAFCGSSTLQMLPALFQKAGADAAQVPLPTQAAASAAIAW